MCELMQGSFYEKNLITNSKKNPHKLCSKKHMSCKITMTDTVTELKTWLNQQADLYLGLIHNSLSYILKIEHVCLVFNFCLFLKWKTDNPILKNKHCFVNWLTVLPALQRRGQHIFHLYNLFNQSNVGPWAVSPKSSFIALTFSIKLKIYAYTSVLHLV